MRRASARGRVCGQGVWEWVGAGILHHVVGSPARSRCLAMAVLPAAEPRTDHRFKVGTGGNRGPSVAHLTFDPRQRLVRQPNVRR